MVDRTTPRKRPTNIWKDSQLGKTRKQPWPARRVWMVGGNRRKWICRCEILVWSCCGCPCGSKPMASLDWQQGPLEDTGRGPQSCARLAAAVKKQKKTGLTCFWWWWYWWWWWWCWWWWWWWTWPKWNLLIPRRNFVTEWTSFTNLIQVYAVPEAWTRLYIHIYIYIIYIYIHLCIYEWNDHMCVCFYISPYFFYEFIHRYSMRIYDGKFPGPQSSGTTAGLKKSRPSSTLSRTVTARFLLTFPVKVRAHDPWNWMNYW